MIRLILVEPDPTSAQDIHSRLQRVSYVVVVAIASVGDVIERANDLKPDIVLMDIRMKGERSSIEAAREIKKRHNIPVIFIATGPVRAMMFSVFDSQRGFGPADRESPQYAGWVCSRYLVFSSSMGQFTITISRSARNRHCSIGCFTSQAALKMRTNVKRLYRKGSSTIIEAQRSRFFDASVSTAWNRLLSSPF